MADSSVPSSLRAGMTSDTRGHRTDGGAFNRWSWGRARMTRTSSKVMVSV
ncbi:hypothetical protein JQX13_29065 [Archangium violaceum]|nr:hypothetical protein [Archangium violaceum]QRK04312.1 hypothetical protein JQX13_29065 [Archangium violaceum]